MTNFYSQFLDNLSHELAPLYSLLKSSQLQKWGKKETKAFNRSKQMLSSDLLLVHYDLRWLLTLTCDASPYESLAILSHKSAIMRNQSCSHPDHLEMQKSVTHNWTKKHLGVIFGITKIYGCHIKIRTDHKPLLGLFREKKSIPDKASLHIQNG